jgi:hypothetical protein
MKNYVVWTNCSVNELPGDHPTGIVPINTDESRRGYDQMFKISRSSARKFLHGEWEEIVYTDPAPSRLAIFQRNWQRIHDLWHQEPCNILYLDSDTMFLKPTEMFGRFLDYRLFNWTDPKSCEGFSNLYNAGVRYYPSTMSKDLWTVGNKMAHNWDPTNWNQEQEIFNTMFWQQSVPDPHHPELNWQGMHLRLWQTYSDAIAYLNNWNTIPITDAHIIHVHGSRNAVETADCMMKISQELGISVDIS